MAALNFNARNVAPELPRDPIPAGVYLAHIIESDVVATKTGGSMLKLTHEILDGACKGRRVWSNINVKNPSAEAERIGQAQLSALCHAVNVLDLRESSMLHMIPLRMRVSIRPAGPDMQGVPRDAQNEVKGYEAATGAPAPAAAQRPAAGVAQMPTQQPQQAAQPAAQQPRAGGAAPWARRA